MGKVINLTDEELEELTEEELEILEKQGLIKKREEGKKPEVKREIKTKWETLSRHQK